MMARTDSSNRPSRGTVRERADGAGSCMLHVSTSSSFISQFSPELQPNHTQWEAGGIGRGPGAGEPGRGAREIFPLPLASGRRSATSRSRRCARRRAVNVERDAAYNAAVQAVNEMWQGRRRAPRVRAGRGRRSAVRAAVACIWRRVDSAERRDNALLEEGGGAPRRR